MSNRGRDKFDRYKKIIKLISKIYMIFPYKTRKKFFEMHRNTKGLLGITLRYILISTIVESCGDNVSIHPGVYIFSPENLNLGSNVSIHPMCYIDATGGVDIKSNVSIAHSSSILSTTHTYDKLDINIKEQPIIKSRTLVSDNVWIGTHVVILLGSVINEGSIVAAHTLVNGMVRKNSIVGGIPYKEIKKRT